MTYEEFKTKYAIRLNQQQEEAVRQTKGPVLLLAVPGSGKTTVLVTRLGYMLYGQGIPPERILTVTYTVAATQDMKARFIKLFGDTDADKLTFRTINGLCAVVVQYYAGQKGTQPFTLIDNEQRMNSIVRDLLTRAGTTFPTDIQIKDTRGMITYCKNMMLSDEEIRACKVDGADFSGVYFAYQKYLLHTKQMDYDDQMVFTYRIFRQYPDILAHFQRRWPYLCVDEAQDTSKIQHAILRLLATGNIFMVGDEDQSIYGFRAAWPQALLEFDQVFPEAQVLMLETNYRSTSTIVEHANAFIQRNQSRHPKQMRTENPQGVPPKITILPDYSFQYIYLLAAAENCTQSTAVLYRNNDSALPLIDLLEQKGVPYACRQRESLFFTSPLIRDITDMLKFAFDGGNSELFLRFYYKLDLKLKKVLVSRLLSGMDEEQSVFEALLESGELEQWQINKVKIMRAYYAKLPNLTSFSAIQRLVQDMGYSDYMKEMHVDTSRLDVLLSLANQTPGLEQFLLRLQELKACLENHKDPPGCQFVLSTIHGSKGLEYDHVILIDVADGLFPSASSSEDEALLEEERRLFYVGTTRAKKQLEFLCYKNKFKEPTVISYSFIAQFLNEAPAEQLEPMGRTDPTAEQIKIWLKDYIPGTEVTHKIFGEGKILSRTGTMAVIFFRESGEKKIELTICLRGGKIWLTQI